MAQHFFFNLCRSRDQLDVFVRSRMGSVILLGNKSFEMSWIFLTLDCDDLDVSRISIFKAHDFP